jgi:hypothetical protein
MKEMIERLLLFDEKKKDIRTGASITDMFFLIFYADINMKFLFFWRIQLQKKK